jgi:hypothetical protein
MGDEVKTNCKCSSSTLLVDLFLESTFVIGFRPSISSSSSLAYSDVYGLSDRTTARDNGRTCVVRCVLCSNSSSSILRLYYVPLHHLIQRRRSPSHITADMAIQT